MNVKRKKRDVTKKNKIDQITISDELIFPQVADLHFQNISSQYQDLLNNVKIISAWFINSN
jgi:hypothetical protein